MSDSFRLPVFSWRSVLIISLLNYRIVVAAPAHPCARGVPSVHGHKKGATKVAPRMVDANYQLKAHPHFCTVMHRPVGNDTVFIRPRVHEEIGSLVGEIIDEEIHTPAFLINPGPDVTDSEGFLWMVAEIRRPSQFCWCFLRSDRASRAARVTVADLCIGTHITYIEVVTSYKITLEVRDIRQWRAAWY